MSGLRGLRGCLGALLLTAALASTGCATPGPDAVIGQAVEAARDGDREAFAACFTPRSRPLLETWWRAVDEKNPALGALGAGDVQVVSGQLLGGRDMEAERAVLTLREGAATMRVVVHRMGGMWRIDLLDTERAMMGFAAAP